MRGDRLPQGGKALEDGYPLPDLDDLAWAGEDEQVLALDCVADLRGGHGLELIELVVVDHPELGGVDPGLAVRRRRREQFPSVLRGRRMAGRPSAAPVPRTMRSRPIVMMPA